MNSFSSHLPFGTKDVYVNEIMVADLDKLAGLIRICGFLMQTKAYLFWKRKMWKWLLWACFSVVSAGDVYVAVVDYAVFYYVAVRIPLGIGWCFAE